MTSREEKCRLDPILSLYRCFSLLAEFFDISETDDGRGYSGRKRRERERYHHEDEIQTHHADVFLPFTADRSSEILCTNNNQSLQVNKHECLSVLCPMESRDTCGKLSTHLTCIDILFDGKNQNDCSGARAGEGASMIFVLGRSSSSSSPGVSNVRFKKA